MRWVRFAVLVAIVTFIQASHVLDWVALSRFDVKPDLLLLMVIFYSLNAEGYEAVIAAFSLGLAADIISSSLGPYILTFGLCGSLLSNMHHFIAIKKTMHTVATVFFCGIATGVIAGMLMHLKGHDSAHLFVRVFGISAYSAIISPYVFSGLGIMSNWLGVKRYHVVR
jgi:rod shape-determining protein MreD